MPVTVGTRYDYAFETAVEGSITVNWFAFGSEDEDEVSAALAASVPTAIGTKKLKSLGAQHIGNGNWEAVAAYQETASQFTFETGGGTAQITQSLGTIASYPAGAPNFQGAIGVSNDKVEGTTITVPQYQFTETHYFSAAAITAAYKTILATLTGRVNNATFKGTAAGETLFLGASGSNRGTDDVEIQFKFAVSPNATGLVIGNITGINKKGWEYLWVRYEDRKDANVLVKQPTAVYVEKVYDTGDLSLLGIGV